MSKFVIFADSTCDLDKEMRQRYDIDYVPMNYVIDEDEYVASLDWECHSAKELYDIMRSGKRVYTTQVPQNAYIEKFKAVLDKGMDVLYISCSSALSGSINIAKVVIEQLKAEYPDRAICCVDALICSLGQGHLAIMASLYRAEGHTVEETAKYIEDNRFFVNQFGTVESLEYLRRAGRVTASSAFFGNLFGVKPIIISDRIGQNYAIKKVKGAKNAKREIANLIKEAANGVYDTLYISHADCIKDAEALRDEILEIAPFKNVHIGIIGPIVGASVGPGTIIAYCYGNEVTIEGRV